MIDAETLAFLADIGAKVSPCGSRVTCNPPPMDTDEDFLVSIQSRWTSELMVGLELRGWKWEGSSEHYQNTIDDGFSSFRKDQINLIVSANEEFVRRHVVATALCTRLNLLNKQDRIALFQAVLYGQG